MTTEQVCKQTINELVKREPRVLRILGEYGIDTCCGGARTIEDAAKTGGIDLAKLEREIEALLAAKTS